MTVRSLLPALALLLAALAPLPLHACESEAFEKLRHLVGRWEVYRDERLIGKLVVQPAAGNCALLEQWRASDGTEAIAMHWTEPGEPEEDEAAAPARVLRQVYVDASGWVVKAKAYVENGALVYEGPATIEGKDVVLRATLHGLGENEIVHIGDVSKDDGMTWQRISTMKYRRAQ